MKRIHIVLLVVCISNFYHTPSYSAGRRKGPQTAAEAEEFERQRKMHIQGKKEELEFIEELEEKGIQAQDTTTQKSKRQQVAEHAAEKAAQKTLHQERQALGLDVENEESLEYKKKHGRQIKTKAVQTRP